MGPAVAPAGTSRDPGPWGALPHTSSRVPCERGPEFVRQAAGRWSGAKLR